jgi:septum formation protein
MTPLPPLILASASPRRAELLRMLGLPFEIRTGSVVEDPLPGELPVPHVERLARAKAQAVSCEVPEALVLGGDTVVVSGGRILGKPRDADDAVSMLLGLAGRPHQVVSGLALFRNGLLLTSGTRSTVVHFRPFGPEEATAYVETGEPMDKAGAYGIQGLGAVLVEGIEGDHSTVVGLPIPLLLDLLQQAGYPFRFPGPAAPPGVGSP